MNFENDYLLKTIGLPRLLDGGVPSHLSGSIGRALSGAASAEDDAILHNALNNATFNYRPLIREPFGGSSSFLSSGGGSFLR